MAVTHAQYIAALASTTAAENNNSDAVELAIAAFGNFALAAQTDAAEREDDEQRTRKPGEY